MKGKAADYLVYDRESGTYHEDPEQAVRDDVEKHYWLNVGRTIVKDWRLYVMLVPMLLVFLFWRYFPMYELLGSFKVPDGILPVNEQLFSGFSYFKQLLVGGDSLSQNFWMAMRNTFLLSFYGLCFGFPMPIILALFFNEVRSNIARSTLQVMTYLPKFMSTRDHLPGGRQRGPAEQPGLFPRDLPDQRHLGGSGIRQHRVLRRDHRDFPDKLRGRADRRGGQVGPDAVRGPAQHPFHDRDHADHADRITAEYRI